MPRPGKLRVVRIVLLALGTLVAVVDTSDAVQKHGPLRLE
jgi:hypothetical protein